MKTLNDILLILERYKIILEETNKKVYLPSNIVNDINNQIKWCNNQIQQNNSITLWLSTKNITKQVAMLKDSNIDFDALYKSNFNIMDKFIIMISNYIGESYDDTINKILFG